jgi:hypothetical protein
MSIQELNEKIRPFYAVLLLLVLGAIFFILGRFSALQRQKTGVIIDNSGAGGAAMAVAAVGSTSPDTGSEEVSAATITQTATTSAAAASDSSGLPAQSGEVIGSKSGKKYYFPWCGTVKRIKPENQVHFASIETAKAAGFTPGGNCKGLQ